MKKYLLFDIGGTEIKYEIMDIDLNSYYKNKVLTPIQGEDKTVQLIVDIINELKKEYDIVKVGMSIPGAVDEEGKLYWVGAVTDFAYLDLGNIIEEKTGLQCKVLNDANCFALAEKWRGNAQNVNNFIAITIGTGVGAGVVINNQLYYGNKSMGGEVGLLILKYITSGEDYEKVMFSNYGSSRYLTEEAQRLGLKVDNVKDIYKLLDENNEQVKVLLDEFYNTVAIGIINVAVTLAPEKILIGGGISNEPRFLLGVKEKINELFSAVFNFSTIEECKFTGDSGKVGILYYLTEYEEATCY